MFFFQLIALFISVCVADTVTSWSPEQLSSASSRALQSDATLIYNVLMDLNTQYTSYLKYMDSNGMHFPAEINQYMVKIQTINDESSLMAAIKTMSFPFSEFQTMMTVFPWYSSIMSNAVVTTFYEPSDFLMEAFATTSASAVETASESFIATASSVSSTSSVHYTTSSSFSSSTSFGTSSSKSSSASSSSSSNVSSSKSTTAFTSATSSTNGVSSLYIPVALVTLLMAFV
jgi:hypothetical protein